MGREVLYTIARLQNSVHYEWRNKKVQVAVKLIQI